MLIITLKTGYRPRSIQILNNKLLSKIMDCEKEFLAKQHANKFENQAKETHRKKQFKLKELKEREQVLIKLKA